jgi:PhzF family phenazine biosynthesis protein
MTRPFQTVDVFGQGDFSGNPVAVVFAADDLSTEEMQRITRWLNLSETTFLIAPSDEAADYHVRIFTLERELPFAGHPTLGTCHAWLAAGGRPRDDGMIVQQCGAGLIPIRRNSDGLAFAAPPLMRSGPVDEADLDEALGVLGLGRGDVVEARWVDNGPGWLGIMLPSADQVLGLQPKRHHSRRIDLGIVGPHAPGGEVDWELRAIFSDPHGALIEDPVTGSLNASVAQWLFESGRSQGSYVAAQGTAIGRTGRIFVEQADDGAIWIGGKTKTFFAGTAAF